MNSEDLQQDSITQRPEQVLSDILRTSNLGQEHLLNNSGKSPFQLFQKEGQQEVQINIYSKYDEDMLRRPKDDVSTSSYKNQSNNDNKKELVKFKIIKQPNNSSKSSSKLLKEEAKGSKLSHQQTHKEQPRRFDTLEVPGIIKQSTTVKSEDKHLKEEEKNFFDKVFDITGGAFLRFGNLLKNTSPSHSARETDAHPISLEKKDPFGKKESEMINTTEAPEFKIIVTNAKSDTKTQELRQSQRQRLHSSNAKGAYTYNKKQVANLKNNGQNLQDKRKQNLNMLQDILNPNNQQRQQQLQQQQQQIQQAQITQVKPDSSKKVSPPQNKQFVSLAQLLKPSPSSSTDPISKFQFGLPEGEENHIDQLMKFPKSNSSTKVTSTNKQRSKNISALANKYQGKDKLENEANTTSISDATTNPSPNPPHFIGLTPGEALTKYKDELTMFEKTELSQFEQIYTIGSVRRETLQEICDNDGYYKTQLGEQIGYRYQITEIVDKGAFGQVVKCFDLKEGGREVAVKISRNKKFDVDNAQVEVKILETLKNKDKQDKYGIVKIRDNFPFRRHMVLVFEFLGVNLYRYMRQENFRGLKNDMLRQISTQLLQSLVFLKRVGVIHCDLKPENILFNNEKCQQVKVIDFGSSCFSFKSGFTYVQSRYYRCPEILLGLPYSQGADMWSFGCIVAELTTGRPLFPALDENELLEFFIMIRGPPTQAMVTKAKKKNKFFDKDMKLIKSKNSRVKNIKNKSLPLKDAVYSDDDPEFIDFLEKCLNVDPEKRMTPEEGLKHPWINKSGLKTVLKQNDDIVQSVINDSSFSSRKQSLSQNPSFKGLPMKEESKQVEDDQYEDIRQSEISDSHNTRHKPQAIIKK